VSSGFAGDVAGDPLSYALPDLPLKDLDRAAELVEELESIVARMPPGSFTQDPGMRAGDEFTDVGSAGYRESAERVAERGGAKEYATSVEEEEGRRSAEQKREWTARILAALVGGSAFGSGMQRLSTSPKVMGALNPGIVGPAGPGQFMKYSRGGEGVTQVLGGLGGAFAAGLGPLSDAAERLKERKGWPPYDVGDPRRGPSGPRRRGGR
jgi:hypothetical protein